jgi:hypothetical protein
MHKAQALRRIRFAVVASSCALCVACRADKPASQVVESPINDAAQMPVSFRGRTPPKIDEADAERFRQIALRTINSAEAWERFPERKHAENYVVKPKGSIELYNDHDREGAVTVAVPIERPDLHGWYVAVVIVRDSGEIVDLYESFWP